MEFSDQDIREQLEIYKRALKNETQASVSVRELWRKLIAMLCELLVRRAKEKS